MFTTNSSSPTSFKPEMKLNLLSYIFMFLAPREIELMNKVCKRFKKAIDNSNVLKLIIINQNRKENNFLVFIKKIIDNENTKNLSKEEFSIYKKSLLSSYEKKVVYLSYNKIGRNPDDLKLLPEGLRDNKTITQLKLSGNNIGDNRVFK